MLEQVVKPLSSGSILPWLTASRIVTTNSLSQLATPSSISSDQSLTLSGSATATVAGLLTAQSALTVASAVTLTLQTASHILTTDTASAVSSPSAISTAQTLTLSTTTGTTLTVSSTQGSTAIGNGSVVLAGGASIAGESFFGANITATQSLNGAAQFLLRNTDTAGTSAQCNIQVANASSPTANMVIGAFGASRSGTQFGVNRANACFIYSSAASTSAFVIGHTGVAAPVILGTNNVEVARVTSSGSFSIGTGAVATTATNGFLYVTACAGTPTGVPTAITGRVPIVVDSTNNKLYFYSGGAWRDAGP